MKKLLKKDVLFSGTLYITVFIVISKIFDMFYIIPLHSILDNTASALYGYVYIIYYLFVSLTTLSIPIVISSIVFEYQTLGYYNIKQRVLILGRKVAFVFGLIIILVLCILAPFIAKNILGDIAFSISVSDITVAIRVVSISLLIVPVLNVYRGYFEGHRFTNPISLSKAIEKIVAILFIVFFSYLTFYVFKLSLSNSISLIVLGFFIGSIVSFGYLIFMKYKNRKRFEERIRHVNEPLISNKDIIKKIVVYALPFIFIDISKGLYSYIDINSIMSGLINYANFNSNDALEIVSIFSIWAFKFNIFIFSFSLGIFFNMLPDIKESIMKNDSNCTKKINRIFEVLLFFIIPVVFIISFLAKPIWILFFGLSKYGPNILSYYIFVCLFMSIFFVTIYIIQLYKDYKTIVFSVLLGFILKLLLNNSLIIAFYKMGIPAYYGIITASILGYLVSFCFSIVMLSKKFKINYEDLVKYFIDIFCGSMLAVFSLFIVKLFIPIYSEVRIVNLFIIVFYAIVGLIIYLIFMRKTGAIKHIFNGRIINVVKRKK